MRVADVMTRNVACVRASDTCAAAVRIMWDRDCGAVPVLDDEGARVVGMVTDRDICIACWSHDRPPQGILVSEAMTRDVHSCSPNDSIAKAEDVMRTRQVRRVPVLEAGERLVGLISLADIVRSAHTPGHPTDKGIEPEQLTETLATICEPRPVTRSAVW